MSNKMIEVYREHVINFFEECSKAEIEKKIQEEHPSLFIPGVGMNYEKVKPKVMYIGIDNNGWNDLGKQIKEYNEVKDNADNLEKFVESIINFASLELDEKKPFTEWYSSFWKFVLEAQKAIFKKYGKEEDENIIKTSFAWSNTNAIELFDNIQNEDKETYDIIKKFSKPFDNLYISLKALETKPDLVIILNWNEEIDYVQMNVIDSEKQDDKHLRYYLVEKEGIKLPIIWTAHPRYLCAKGGIGFYVNEILKIIEDKSIF